MTSADVLRALEARYCRPEWFLFREATFERRRFDALAIGVYRSRGNLLVGFEIKVDRGDVRRELANAAKADPLWRRVDEFYLVAPLGLVALEDVPAPWGALEVRPNGRLRRLRAPPRRPRVTLERDVLVRLLLKQEENCDGALEAARRERLQQHEALVAEALEDARERAREENGHSQRALVDLQEQVAAFEAAAGFRLSQGWKHDSKATGEAVAALLALGDDADLIVRRRRLLAEVDAGLERLDRALAALRCSRMPVAPTGAGNAGGIADARTPPDAEPTQGTEGQPGEAPEEPGRAAAGGG